MKKLILALTIILGAGSMSAQATFGAKISIGKNMSGKEKTFVGQPFDFIHHEVEYVGSNAVKNIGVFYQHKFGWLYVKSELGYTQYTQQYDVKSYVQVANPRTYATEKFQFIDMQVMAGLTKKNFRIGVGPIAHVLVANSTELDFIGGFQSKIPPMTFGYKVGLGYDRGGLTLDLNYEMGFRKVGGHLYYINRMARTSNKANILSFTIGIAI